MTDLLYLEMVPDAKGSEGMLTVDHYELIRRKVLIEGLSRLDLSGRPDLITRGNGVRDTGIYDRLKAREAVLL